MRLLLERMAICLGLLPVCLAYATVCHAQQSPETQAPSQAPTLEPTSPPQQHPPDAPEDIPESDPLPVMFPHPETDSSGADERGYGKWHTTVDLHTVPPATQAPLGSPSGIR